MAEKRPQRRIELLYDFDRLFSEKILQVYGLLAPERIQSLDEAPGGTEREAGSNLHASFLGEAKRRTHHR
jgi:hypothetical protein